MTLAEFFKTNSRLAEEWDKEANAKANISPDKVGYASARTKAWWRCSGGHSWQASVASRTRLERGCPYCSGKVAVKGYNDLETMNKEALKIWDYEKNTDISPSEVTEFSTKKVWWKCELGHSWQQQVQAITRSTTASSGCPVCNGLQIEKGFNDLLFLNPEVAEQWCYELNSFGPDEIMPASHKVVWWKCDLGHTWQAPPYLRTGSDKTKCPYCANKKVWEGFNDLKTVNPRLASEWHETLNGDLKPTQVTRGSKKKVWWECSAGHVWQAYIYSRARDKGTGCPVCAGKVKDKHPDF